MFQSFRKSFRHSLTGLSRRELFTTGSLLGLPAIFRSGAVAAPAATTGLKTGANVYQSIGVRPVINCRGTFTIISGSLMLPEVRAAIDSAAQRYVHLDELMDGVGARLAELTKAEWGMVSSGCAAGLTHATAACVAGGNPDLHVRMPNLEGFQKDEVIIPKHSRNVYDASVRAVGVKVIEVETAAELDLALGPRTAMVYILASPAADTGPLRTEAVCAAAKKHGVPVLVDAAAEVLTVPNVHLAAGADLVAYSGGKCLRGPQTGGLLLGRKDLVKAAWVHSAPHHGFARGFKVGKEEAIGMLMAVEMWMQRDHKAEWGRWLGWMNHVKGRVEQVSGVTTSLREPTELSNRTPSLTVQWDREKFGISGSEVAKMLLDGEPRIVVAQGRERRDSTETGVTIVAYMMSPGDEKIVADRLHAVLSKAPGPKSAQAPAAPAADLSGRWNVEIRFAAGSSSNHMLHLTQRGNAVTGTHQGDFVARELRGSVKGSEVDFASVYTERHGDSLNFRFTGKLSGDTMSGDLDMGEYLGATWTATRHNFRS